MARAPLTKGNRVNARYRRKISRMVKQMLNQEEKKGGRQKSEWENLKKEGRAENSLKASNLAGNNGTTLDLGGNLLPGLGHEFERADRNVQDRNIVPGTSSSSRNQDWPSPEAFMKTWCDECSHDFDNLNSGCRCCLF